MYTLSPDSIAHEIDPTLSPVDISLSIRPQFITVVCPSPIIAADDASSSSSTSGRDREVFGLQIANWDPLTLKWHCVTGEERLKFQLVDGDWSHLPWSSPFTISIITIEVGHSIECITNWRRPCGAVSLSGVTSQRHAPHGCLVATFLHFLTLWPWSLAFWTNINWWASYRDGLSLCQVWRFLF